MTLNITLTPEQQAAVVLVSLSPETAQPIADRLGAAGLRRVKSTLDGLSHVPLNGAPDLSKDPRLEEVGEILGSLPRSLRDAALKKLDEADIDRASAVRKALLSLEDIPHRLPTRGVQTVFREVEPEILLAGLAAASQDVPEASDFLLGNISQRMADQYRDNMANLSLDTQRERDKAIGALLREFLSLSRRGQITLIERDTNQD